MQDSVSDCSQLAEPSKLPFLPLMSSSAPAAAYLATSVLPSSTTCGGVLTAYAVSSLVVTSDHCWIWTSTLTLGCFALKSAFTPSTTDWGALPFMSQTVRVPLSWAGVLPAYDEHPATASSAPKSATGNVLNLTFLPPPELVS